MALSNHTYLALDTPIDRAPPLDRLGDRLGDSGGGGGSSGSELQIERVQDILQSFVVEKDVNLYKKDGWGGVRRVCKLVRLDNLYGYGLHTSARLS
jgi:hypothetical protein